LIFASIYFGIDMQINIYHILIAELQIKGFIHTLQK